VGGIFYILDALIYLAFQDWLPFAFHGWALFSIWKGGTLLHRLIKAQSAPPPLPSSELTPTTQSERSL
jgi:hypothetical protein